MTPSLGPIVKGWPREVSATVRSLDLILFRVVVVFSALAARSEVAPARWRRPFLNWLDGIEAGWAVPVLLIGFIAVWQAFLATAYFGGDLHPDVLETWTLGRRIEWGYSKHPPLMGWVARAWTSVFPLTN